MKEIFSCSKSFSRQKLFSMYECVKKQRKMACLCTHKKKKSFSHFLLAGVCFCQCALHHALPYHFNPPLSTRFFQIVSLRILFFVFVYQVNKWLFLSDSLVSFSRVIATNYRMICKLSLQTIEYKFMHENSVKFSQKSFHTKIYNEP